MRILGLDVGQKTVGVAISDPLGFTAQGITTIRRTKKSEDIEAVKRICDEYSVETIVTQFENKSDTTYVLHLKR